MMHDRPILLAAVSSTRRDAFVVIVVVHAVVAVAAFGAMALSGVYGSTAQRLRHPGALGEVRRFFAKPPADGAVLAVAPLGVAALLVDPHGSGLGQVWVGAALLLWILASVAWFAVVRPAAAAIGDAVGTGEHDEAPDPRAVATLRTQGRRLAHAGAVTDVVFLVALGLMVFQPG